MGTNGNVSSVLNAPPDPRLLSSKHPHPKDGLVQFFDEGHWYKHVPSGRRVPTSQTKATGGLFENFDAPAIIEKNWKKWRANEDSKYWTLIHYLELAEEADEDKVMGAIAKLWQLNGERAASAGTKMHKELEDYLDGILPPPSAEKARPMGVAQYLGMKEWFYPEEKLEPWRVEFSVCVEVTVECSDREPVVVPAICGNIDALFRSKKDGRIWILDWKRVDPKKKGLLGKATVHQQLGGWGGFKRARSPEMAKAPFDEWEASNYNKYSAQLHGYRWQLIEGGYFKAEEIAGCFLVQMHDELQKAHVIEAADMAEEVDTLMRAEVDAARQAYLDEYSLL